jgi:hypothetical protein
MENKLFNLVALMNHNRVKQKDLVFFKKKLLKFLNFYRIRCFKNVIKVLNFYTLILKESEIILIVNVILNY